MTNEKKIKIRPAAAADLHAIIAIEAECFPPAEAASEKEFRERFQAFGENFFVAETEGRVIGFINGCTTDTAILPDELYHDTGFHKKDGSYQTVFGLDVLPEYRNQGVAAALMETLIQVSRQRGKKGVILTCKDRLRPYYEKFGYQWQGVSDSCHGGAKWNDMLLTFGAVSETDAE